MRRLRRLAHETEWWPCCEAQATTSVAVIGLLG